MAVCLLFQKAGVINKKPDIEPRFAGPANIIKNNFTLVLSDSELSQQEERQGKCKPVVKYSCT